MRVSTLSRDTLVNHFKVFDPPQDFRNTNLVSLIISLVKGETVLDVGSGSGFLLSELKKLGKKAYGIEPIREIIEISKEKYPGLVIYKGFAEDIEKIFPHSVDTIILSDVLEHIENDTEQLRKIYKKINDGGQIIIVVPAYQFLYGKRDKQLGHYRRYSSGILEEALRESGFRVISMRHWNMLGVLPYLLSEKILGKPFNTSLRSGESNGPLKKTLRTILSGWFRYVENNINLGFGLSLICVASKK